MADEAPTLFFASQDEWRSWIEINYQDQAGVWMKIAKKSTGIRSITAPEALDVALCFGWIDGQRRSLDETHFLQRYTPRRSRSKWSKINIGKVEALIASGEMTAAGLAEIERAKADGRWDAAYEPQSRATYPDDFLAAVEESPEAKAFLPMISRQSKYAIIFRIGDAKRPETRARRIAQFVEQLAAGEEVWPRPAKVPPASDPPPG